MTNNGNNKKPGRPAVKDRMDDRVFFRLRTEDSRELREAALEVGVREGAYVRTVLLRHLRARRRARSAKKRRMEP